MDLLNINTLQNFKFKEIKEAVDALDITLLKDNDIESLASLISDDKRKNVTSLMGKLERSYIKYKEEKIRVRKLYDFDRSFGENLIVAGVDEVGRGPLAGPIVAAAVVLDLKSIEDIILYINDSKALSEGKREELSEIIKEKALSYSISEASNLEIDDKGIAYCNNKVFKDACYSLKTKPDLVLSDGYMIKDFKIKNKFVIKGDAHSASIACASIIAKVHRDNLMKEYHKIYPNYDFNNNAGYGTKKHIEGIKNYGITKIHRRSFLRNIENTIG